MAGLTVSEEPGRLTLRSEPGSGATVKAVLFVGLAMVCLFALALISVFSGKPSGEVLQPRSNHVGFLWAFGSVAMLIVFPVYLSRLHRPALALEFFKSDASVRRDGSVVTRFEKIEYFEVSEARDTDGRFQYALTMSYGDGRELPIQQSYDERELLRLSDILAAFTGAKVRTSASSIFC